MTTCHFVPTTTDPYIFTVLQGSVIESGICRIAAGVDILEKVNNSEKVY